MLPFPDGKTIAMYGSNRGTMIPTTRTTFSFQGNKDANHTIVTMNTSMKPFPKHEDHIGRPIKQERCYHLSPFPERKTMLVSGSKRGTRMPEDTSRERRCSGLDSFLEVEVEDDKVEVEDNKAEEGGFETDLVSRKISCRHLSAPNPVVRTRCSPTHTT